MVLILENRGIGHRQISENDKRKRCENPIFLYYYSMQKEQIRFLIEVFALSRQYTMTVFELLCSKINSAEDWVL